MTSMVRTRFVLLTALLSLAATPAFGEVTQPDGTEMPLPSPKQEVTLQELFDFKEGLDGEGNSIIDAVADASTTPSTFRPLCDFTAQFVLAESGNRDNPFGWYNVPEDDTPPTKVCDLDTDLDSDGDACDGDEIYIIMPGLEEGDDPPFGRASNPLEHPGQVFTGSDISSHKYYQGGEIGFVLLTDELHYSESRLNPVCVPEGDSCTAGKHWIPLIMYESKKFPNSYYLGAEDQDVGPAEWGNNDGDFNDVVIFLSGLVCSGAGEQCDTGEPGRCGPGVTGCADSEGNSECKPLSEPTDEACNGLDDDCDGEVDDGDLCDAGEVCDRGVCVARCGGGEFKCAPGKTCNDKGLCVDPACIDKECDPGLVCIKGKCQGPCLDVVCPTGQECRTGRCVDPCENVECGANNVCRNGACVPDCGCTGCPDGSACSESTSLCVAPECASVSCTEGTHCVDGDCVDNCESAVCPGGAACKNGQCDAPDGSTENGSGGAGTGSTGSGIDLDGGLTFPDAGSPGSGGSGGSSGTPVGSAGSTGAGTDSGCGCRTAGTSSTSGWFGLSALLGLGFAVRRRRSRTENRLANLA